jgi:hypothetical protein
MRILFLSFYFKPDLSAGSFRSTALVEALIAQLPSDAHIEVITTLPNRYKSFSPEALKTEVSPRLTIRRISLPIHNSGILDQSIAFMIFCKDVLKFCQGKNYDLVFATSGRLMTAVLGAYISRKLKISLYLDIRDIFVDTMNDVLPKKFVWFLKPAFSLLENWAFGAAKKINLVSEGFLQYFIARYPNKKFVFFTNGIDDEFLKVQPKEFIKSDSRVLNVVYAGNIGEGQGLHTIVPGLADRLSGRVNFRLVGDGGRRMQLIFNAKALGCKNVEILPPVTRDKLIEIYQDADVLFLHLNDYDAFNKVLPSKLFEYAALGKPIWAGVSGYAAKFVKDNISNAAIFSPCDIDGAVNAFETLEMVTQVRDSFVEKFTRTIIMKNMACDIIHLAEIK